MRLIRLLAIILLCFIGDGYIYAQELTGDSDISIQKGLIDTDTILKKEQSKFWGFVDKVSLFFAPSVDTVKKRMFTFFAIPELSFSTENGIGVGASVRTYINRYKSYLSNNTHRKESYIDFGVSITFKEHSSLHLQPEIYFLNDRYLMKGLVKFGQFPQNFWPIGSDSPEDLYESFTQNASLYRFILYRRVFSNAYIGAGIHFYDYNLIDTKEGGILQSGTITGSDGAKISGISLHYLYDSRDNIFVPMKGFYSLFDVELNGKFIGSTEDYTKYVIDLRYYYNIMPNQVLIGQFYSQIAVGDIPFQDMPRLSNGIHSRGYRGGRYIDKNVMSLQGEYRWYFGRFGLAGFVCISNVGPTPLEALNMNKFSAGAGFRIKPFKNQRMYFRMDFGVGADGNVDMYLGVDELF